MYMVVVEHCTYWVVNIYVHCFYFITVPNDPNNFHMKLGDIDNRK